MSWIFLSILAAFIWSVVSILDKYIISKLVDRPIVPVIIMGTIGLFSSAAIFFILGFEPLSTANILLAIIAGIFYVLTVFLYFHAAKIEEISKVVPLFYLTPLFILIIAALFLGEIFTPIKYLGIVLLVIGAILVSSSKLSFNFGKAFWLMVFASVVLAVNQVITKYLLGFADFWTIFGYMRIGAFVALIPSIVINIESFKSIYKEKGLKPFGFITASESLTLLALLSITLAAVTGFITLVNALSSVQSFFVLLLTVVISIFYPQILKEEIQRSTVIIKVIAIAIMFTGVILVS